MSYRSLREGWLPLDEAAAAVDYRASTVRRLAGEGEVEAEKIRYVWVVNVPSLEEYRESRTIGRPREEEEGEAEKEKERAEAMTWVERVGDLAIGATLVILTLVRVVTELVQFFFVTVDRFIVDLIELSEDGLERVEEREQGWISVPGSILLKVLLLILQFLTLFTVLFREAATKLNDFVAGLMEGEGRISSRVPSREWASGGEQAG